jgi:hypothetical protein
MEIKPLSLTLLGILDVRKCLEISGNKCHTVDRKTKPNKKIEDKAT